MIGPEVSELWSDMQSEITTINITSWCVWRCLWKNEIWKFWKNIFFKNHFEVLAFNTSRLPISVHNKFQPDRSSRLTGRLHATFIWMSCFILDKISFKKKQKSKYEVDFNFIFISVEKNILKISLIFGRKSGGRI